MSSVDRFPMNAPATNGSPFDKIRRSRPDGTEYRSARELMPHLGDVNWQKMEAAVERARQACTNPGYAVADHFVGADKMVAIGKGGAPDSAPITR